MLPTYIEIYRLPHGYYSWSMRLPAPKLDRCGSEPTLKEALAAVARVVEGEGK